MRNHDERSFVLGVEKIAALRANALGDYIVSLPALSAIKETYPSAELVLLGSDWHARFLARRPGPVDRVVVVPPSQGVREVPGVRPDEARLEEFFRSMEAERFDLAFQLHGGGRYSNPFVRRLGAGIAVGLCAPDADPLDRSVPYVYYQHEVLRFAEAVALAGVRVRDLQPRIAVIDADLAEAEAAMPDGLEPPLAALHPGAADTRRRWPTEKFAAVGDLLVRAGARVAVTGSDPDAGLAEAVVRGMREDAVSLAGRLTLGGLAGLLSRSAVVVSNDTGPRHLAEAVGTPTVGIYWCGNVINAGPLTRARHRPAISWRIHCPVCGVDCTADAWPARTGGTRCRHSESFTADVEVEEVAASALELLEAERRPRRHEPRMAARAVRDAPAKAETAHEGERADGSAPSPLLTLRPRRIAVLRALQLGDMLCAVPALRALRRSLPDAEIILVALAWARELAERFSAYVDDFFELPGYPGLPERQPDVAALPSFFADAHAREFDLVVQLHGSGEITNPLAVLLGGRRTAGYYRRGGFCPDPELFLPYPEEGPEPRRLLQLIEFLGLPHAGEELEFPLHERDRNALAALPEARRLRPRGYVCVHPGARADSRRWKPESFGSVADELTRRGLQIVLTGLDGERALTERVAHAMSTRAIDLAGRTDLGALAALLADARLLIANDTGVSHLAAALGVPSVVVFTSSDCARWAPLDVRRHRTVLASPEAAEAVLQEAEHVLAEEEHVAG